jgi:formylglycine-generating enzyme required for sulfatase activity
LGVGVSEYDSPIRDSPTSDFNALAAMAGDEESNTEAVTIMGESRLGYVAKGASLPDRDVTNIDSEGGEFERLQEVSDAVLWPPETVFVPSSDEVGEDEAAVDHPIFEDDQADDVFEQSLNGVVLADLAAGFPPEEVSFKQTAPEAVENTETLNRVSEDVPVSNVEEEQESIFAEVSPAADRWKWKKVLLYVGSITLIGLTVFAAGVGTGAWLFRKPVADAPKPTDLFTPEIDFQQQSPPSGMAYVPGGEFIMGSDTDDEFSRPAHLVTVGPFFIDLTEVTNEDYSKFIVATGHRSPVGWDNGTVPEDRDKFPVTGVSWFDAAEYAKWAGKRLPTEEEWEFAARGTDGRTYPWGDDWDPKLANANNRSGGIRNVGEGGRSPFGLFDMSGNAWEWTASDARGFSGGKEFPKSRLHLKIIRGGNWQSDNRTATVVFRGYYGAAGEQEYDGTGFRCVKDVTRD